MRDEETVKALNSFPLRERREYNTGMSSISISPLDRLLDPVAKCLTPDVARRLIALRADPETQARIDELASKANEGMLSSVERTEYEGYVEAIDVVSILQAKARKILAQSA